MPPSSRSSTGRFIRAGNLTRRHRPGFWDALSSTIRGIFSSDRATNPSHPPTEVPAVLETDRQLLEITPPATLHAVVPPQVPPVQQSTAPPSPPATLPAPPPAQLLHDTFRHGHTPGADVGATVSTRLPLEQVPAGSAVASDRPIRGAPLRRHGAFHEHYRPYWNAGSGHEPPIVFGRSPDTLPENQVWDPSWGSVPHLSDITSLCNGPPTPQQVIVHLNARFRLNRRAYYMALDILFPHNPQALPTPRGTHETPVGPGIPVYRRVLETSRWRREHPDWEGGIVPVDRVAAPARADDAADSQAGSGDEDSSVDALTPRERRAIQARVARALPGAYDALLAEAHPSASSSDSSARSGSSSSGSATSSTSSSSSDTGTSSEGSASSSSSSSSRSSSSPASSPSSRKRRRDDDNHSDADSEVTLCGEDPAQRPQTRRRVDADSSTPPTPASSSPTPGPRHRPRSGADTDERRARRKLMRQTRHLLPPIGPPGVRIGAPAPASDPQQRASASGVVDADPGLVAYVPAQPVAGPSRPPRDREVSPEVPPLGESRKRSRDEDTSETVHTSRDGGERERDGKRKKKRSKRD